jgi:hypothetical protein
MAASSGVRENRLDSVPSESVSFQRSVATFREVQSMKRFIALLLVLGALLALTTSDRVLADPGRVFPTWHTANLFVRRSGNTLTGQTANQVFQGYIDSSQVYNGATGRVDTCYFSGLDRQWFQSADSLTLMRVEVIGTQAFASGESLYVTFDGHESGNNYTVLGSAVCGTCASGGFSGAGSLVPGTTFGASKLFNGKPNATSTAGGNVASTIPLLANSSIYGGFYGYPDIRIRIRSDFATAPVAQLISYKIWFVSGASDW